MKYNTELIALLEANKAIDKVWLNKDVTEWHLTEKPDFKEVKRDVILKAKK